MIEVGIARVAMSVVRQSRMKSRIVAETSTAGEQQVELHLLDRLDDEPRLILDDLDLDVRRQGGPDLGRAAP